MDGRRRRERFRAVLAGDTCHYPASVYDPISTRIAGELGFPAGMLAGSVASLAVLGAPDLGVITLTELAELAHRITRGSELPVIVDADHGYGNALNVARTVDELETAGIAALTIEDTALPAIFGQARQTSLVSVEEGEGKMRAAVAARRDPSLVILARTGAPSITGLDDAVERCRRYLACGVDGLFITGLDSRAQLEMLSSAVGAPTMLGQVRGELADRDYLGGLGVRFALQGHHPFMAAIAAVERTMRALREGTAPEALEGVASSALVKRVSRDPEYQRATDEYL